MTEQLPLPEPEWLERKGLIFDPLDEDITKPAYAPLYTADQMHAHAAAVSAERDARIEALQTECDASNAEGIELTAQVAALREEVAEVLAQNIKCVFAVNEYNTAIQNLVAERDALRSARIAYASAFSLNADGEPDVGNIHANIRAMKGRVKVLEDALRKAIVQNEHDMLMTGEELRAASAALGDKT